MKTYFYKLIDPRDNAIRYIGQSKNPKDRLSRHVNDALRGRDKNSRKVKWILFLLNNDMYPILDVFESYTGNVDSAHKQEWKHIKMHIANGCDLVNGNDGGVPYILPDSRVFPVYQYEKSTGIFINKYRCAFDAFCETGIRDSNISRTCKNEFLKQSFPGGFIWSYNQHDIYPIEKIPDNRRGNPKGILAKNLDTTIVYKSARLAALALNLDYRQISACARGEQNTYKGYTFSFIDHDIVRSLSKDIS